MADSLLSRILPRARGSSLLDEILPANVQPVPPGALERMRAARGLDPDPEPQLAQEAPRSRGRPYQPSGVSQEEGARIAQRAVEREAEAWAAQPAMRGESPYQFEARRMEGRQRQERPQEFDATTDLARETMAYIGTIKRRVTPEEYPWLFRRGRRIADEEIADLVTRSAREIEGFSPQDAARYLFGPTDQRPERGEFQPDEAAPTIQRDPREGELQIGEEATSPENQLGPPLSRAGQRAAQLAEQRRQDQDVAERQERMFGDSSGLGRFTGGVMQTFVAAGQRTLGGVLQSLPGMYGTDEFGRDEGDTIASTLRTVGRDIGERGRDRQQAADPGYDQYSPEWFAFAAVESLAEMGAAVGIGLTTRSPATVASFLMGARVYGERFDESIREGRGPRAAMADATIYGLAEMLPERIALGRIMRPGSSFGRRVAEGTIAEGAQEMITEVIQTGYDVGILNEEMTWTEAVQQIGAAGLIGAIVGGSVAGAVHPVRSGADRRAALSELDSATFDPAAIDAAARDAFRPGAPTDVVAPPSLLETRPGVLRSALEEASVATAEDEASPLPTDLITEGRSRMAEAVLGEAANNVLTSAGLPPVNTRVVVTMPGGQPLVGTLEDITSDEEGQGVRVRFDNGRTYTEYLNDIADAGVSIQELSAFLTEVPEFEVPDLPTAPAAAPQRPVGAGGRDVLRARIRGAESSGDDTAENTRSSASGRYQFTDDTFVAYHERVYGGRLSRQQRLRQKNDPAVQERLMSALMDDNENSLEQAGFEPSAGNMYLSHFLGAGGATSVLRNPNAPIERIVGQEVVDANPHLRGMTGADVVAWAARRMNEPVPGMGRAHFADGTPAEPDDDGFNFLSDPLSPQTASPLAIPFTDERPEVPEAVGATPPDVPAPIVPTIAPTRSGRGITVGGVTPEQLTEIRAVLPRNASLIRNAAGEYSLARKYERPVRDILDPDGTLGLRLAEPQREARPRPAAPAASITEASGIIEATAPPPASASIEVERNRLVIRNADEVTMASIRASLPEGVRPLPRADGSFTTPRKYEEAIRAALQPPAQEGVGPAPPAPAAAPNLPTRRIAGELLVDEATGAPHRFATQREAARFLTSNEMSGDFEIKTVKGGFGLTPRADLDVDAADRAILERASETGEQREVRRLEAARRRPIETRLRGLSDNYLGSISAALLDSPAGPESDRVGARLLPEEKEALRGAGIEIDDSGVISRETYDAIIDERTRRQDAKSSQRSTATAESASIDEIIARGEEDQRDLAAFGETFSRRVEGVNFVNPGIKRRERIEEKVRLEGYTGPEELRDVARVGFVVSSIAEADAIVEGLGEQFTIERDKGWRVGSRDFYLDRKVIVRTAGGRLAEIQITPQPIEAARRSAIGKLYKKARTLPAGPERDALDAQMREGYAAALRGSEFESFSSALRSASGNSSENAARESAALEPSAPSPALETSPGASRQPFAQTQADLPSSTATGLSSISKSSSATEATSEPNIEKPAASEKAAVISEGDRAALTRHRDAETKGSPDHANANAILRRGSISDKPNIARVEREVLARARAAAPQEEGAAVSPNRIFTEEAAERARRILRDKFNQTHSGLDPELVQAGITLAGYHIERGARTFAAYARVMIDDLGDAARPYLRAWYEAIRHYPGLETAAREMSSPEEIGAALADLNRADVTPDADSGTIVPQETRRGVQGNLPEGDARTGPEDVQPAPPERRSGRPRAEEERGGAQPDRGSDEGPRQAAERGGARSQRATGRGETGTLDVDRVPERDAADTTAVERRGVEAAPAVAAPQGLVATANFRLDPAALAESRSAAEKARDNLAAIEIVKSLDQEARPATIAEQEALAKYVGWGGLKNAFDETHKDYQPRLKEMLSAEEYDTARRSIQYAHYTSEKVIAPMWEAVQRMGFTHGRIFEPGMGTGNFLGLMPGEAAARSSYAGIEFDYITARIGQLLYPKAEVQHADFTRTPVPQGYFDLAIGNPPFSQTQVRSDPAYKQGFVLHDYFFAKSLDAVRPGGLLMFVTSAGTMNKLDTQARDFLADRADLVGAVRLPGGAFLENAGTAVTTDIIVLRKRLDGEAPGDRTWTETVEVELPAATQETKRGLVNRYFAEHPEMVLGEQGFFDKLYPDRYAVRPTPGTDLGKALREALERLPADIIVPAGSDPTSGDGTEFGGRERKDGSFYVGGDGRLMQQRGNLGVPVQTRGKGVKGGIPAKDQARIKGLIPIRDALREVYSHDLAGNVAKGEKARKALNRAYDAFVLRHGPINKAEISYRRPTVIQQEVARHVAREEVRLAGQIFLEGSFDPSDLIARRASTAEIAAARRSAKEAAELLGREWDDGSFDPADMPDLVIVKRPNIDPFMDDQEGYRLRAIEHYNDDTAQAKKGAVFFENIISKERQPEIRSADDALLYVLNRVGHPDINEIARLASISRGEALDALGSKVFRVPGLGETYQTREKYLSGNVREKLTQARAAAERDAIFQRNVEALEDVQPTPLGPADISANLGMPWIPAETIADFGRALGLNTITARYRKPIALWLVEGDRASAASTSVWGTSDKDAITLIQDALNRQDPKVFRKVRTAEGAQRDVLDEEATQAAQDKQRAIRDRFSKWIWEDAERADALVGLYNRDYNNLVAPEYDGSYLTTPGIASFWRWRPHQSRVIARIIQEGNTYMAHGVGAGKTSAAIGAGMEMRRLGLVRKPMYTVPNHMLGQFTKEFYEQYPTAKIMVADERQFHTDRRKQFIANLAAEDLDAVIITHSAFGFIAMSDAFQQRLIQDQIDDYRDILNEVKAETKAGDGRGDRITQRRIEQQIEALEQRLTGLTTRKRDQVFTFEETGVDFLFVDEAHLFRKLDFATRMSNVRGIDPQGSQASFDLYSKTRYLEGRSPARSHVLMSGTPVTNTMAELFSISRYLQPAALGERGLEQFDAWAGAFGETVTALEQDPAGGYKPQTRFARFVNIPELSAMVRQVMDVVTSKQLEEFVVRPRLKGGKRNMVLAQPTPWLKSFQKGLEARMTAIQQRSGPPQKGDDILLSVIGDGRKAAIDPRLVDAGLSRDDGSKLEQMIANAVRVWKETKNAPFHKPDQKTMAYEPKPYRHGPAAQLIFSDLGINGDFPVHQYIRNELVRLGIPRAEVALISEAKNHVQRQRLFNDVNEGKVRIMVGSVPKMGTGVNAQKQLYAIHNLDPQWYPANDEQRNGRGLRQGNENPEIEIFDYSTKGTYDSQMWNLMEIKARFIEGFFAGDPTLRTMDDLGEASQYEQAKAISTADPRILELTGYKQDLERALIRRAAFEREQYVLRERIADAQTRIETREARIPRVEADIARRVDIAGDSFTGTVGKETFSKRAEFGEAVQARLVELAQVSVTGRRKPVAEVAGFKLTADVDKWEGQWSASLFIQLDGREEAIRAETPAGIAQSVQRIVSGLEGYLATQRREIEELRATIADLSPQTGKRFEGGAEITDLEEKVRALEATLTAEAAARAVGPRAALDVIPPAEVRSDRAAFGVGEPQAEQYAGADDEASSQADEPVRRDSEGLPPRRGGAVRALGIADDLRREGTAALVGRAIRSETELAEIAQVYRDPRYETFRVFFMKGSEIVHATGVSARLPGEAPLLPRGLETERFNTWLDEQMKAAGADGYYLMHNHPSGDPNPSRADLSITKHIAENVPGYRGHIVINSNRYALISARGEARVIEKDFGEDRLLKASRPHFALGQAVPNAAALAAVGKMVQRPNQVTLIAASRMSVRAIVDFPEADLSRSPVVLMAALRRVMRRSGATDIFLVGSPEIVAGDVVRKAMMNDILTEAVDFNGKFSGNDDNRFIRRPDPFTSQVGQFVAEEVRETRSLFGAAAAPSPRTVSDILDSARTLRGRLSEGFDRWRTAAQDRMLPLLRTQQAAERVLGRELGEGENPYIGEELMSGRVGAQLERLADGMVSPLFEAMKEEKISADELESYLYARHAPERNAQIADINPDFADGRGSGMSDTEAAAIMTRIERDGRTRSFERVADRVDAILKFALDTRLETGLMSQDQVDQWRKTYQHYVPLRGLAELDGTDAEAARPTSGVGINVRGPESRRAFGRRSKADDILAYAIMQAEEAIIRGNKNLVARQLYDLAVAAPDPDFWQINKVTMKRDYNPLTGLVETRPVTVLTAEDKDWTISLKIDGKERRITMNRRDPAARRLAEAMRRLDEQQVGKIIQFFGKVNRWLSAVNTSFNPEFIITNAFRDVQTAGFNLTGFDKKGLVKGTLKDYRKALVAATRGAFKSDKGDPEWARWYREFLGAGGRVYFNQVKDVDELRKDIERRVAAMSKEKLSAGTMALRTRGLLTAVGGFINNVNSGVENAIRLSAYKNARERGMTVVQAASLAKNLTVNFNRRGSSGQALNAAYLFYNASIQGSARLIMALGSRRVRKLMAGVVLVGAAVEVLNVMASGVDDDDELLYDKISDFDKSRNLIIMIPGASNGQHIKIPLPYGYNVFYGTGRSAVELLRGRRPGDVLSALGTTIVDSFNPIGGTETLLNFVAPTVIDPIVDLTTNRDFAGRPIMPDQNPFSTPTPDNQRYWGSVNPIWRGVTDGLNRISGGDDVQPGAVDVSPETLEHLFGVATGAAGAFYDRTAGLGVKAWGIAAGDETIEIERNDIPLLRKLTGEKPGWFDRSAYYARVDHVEQTINFAREYRERRDQPGFERFVSENFDVLSADRALKRTRRQMRLFRRERDRLEMGHDLGQVDDATYQARRVALRDIEARIMSEFSAAYLSTVEQPAMP